jgi:hypothetical protein
LIRVDAHIPDGRQVGVTEALHPQAGQEVAHPLVAIKKGNGVGLTCDHMRLWTHE